jgi:hypothetical protein
MSGFQRITPIGLGTIRGPARLVVAPVGTPFPSTLAQIINVAAINVGYVPAVETISITGAPTGGTFQLAFQTYQSPAIPYNATAVQVQAALNAIAGVVSAGGVTCTGGPVNTTPVVATFGVNGSQPLLTTVNALTGGATPAVTVAMTAPGNGQYDVAPGSAWTELGSTRSGVQSSRNNTETQLDVDQVYSSIMAVPDEWEMTVATQFAETTFANLQMAWEGGTITLDTTQTPNEQHLPMGAPLRYTERLLAVLHQKTIGPDAGGVRALVYRRVLRSPQNSTLDYQKTGQMQTIPHSFRAFADWTITNEYNRFADFIEQVF